MLFEMCTHVFEITSVELTAVKADKMCNTCVLKVISVELRTVKADRMYNMGVY